MSLNTFFVLFAGMWIGNVISLITCEIIRAEDNNDSFKLKSIFIQTITFPLLNIIVLICKVRDWLWEHWD